MGGLVTTIILAFLVNLPLGRWRAKTRKFSVSWFLAIHLSIPLIIYLRTFFSLGLQFVPLTIAGAMLGQMAGTYTVMFVIKNRRLKRNDCYHNFNH